MPHDGPPLNRLDPHAIYRWLVALGDAWAEADEAASLLEETKKSLQAKIAEDIRGEADRMGDARAMAKAAATEEYRDHVARMVAARKVALRARVRYDCGKVAAEAARSANANKRAEMQLGSLTG